MNEATNKHERRSLIFALVARSFLLVAFAIAFIAPLTMIFGNENSPMAVAIFCILLSIRFVDFGCCLEDALENLVTVFLLLWFAPVLADNLPFILALGVHFIALATILFMTSDKPEMGNGGLFGFAYVFLTGNPVSGDAFFNRFLLAVVGIIVCGLVYVKKHRHKNADVPFHEKKRAFSLKEHKHEWQFRMALGVSLLLACASAFDLERFMWAGFACGSILSESCEQPNIQRKSSHRLIGMLTGCAAFYAVFTLVPQSLRILIAPLGGFCLGFCTDYRYKTAFNCFGALILASGIYGLDPSVLLRITDTVIGVVFAVVFFYIFDFIFTHRFMRTK